jgi:hypothetical protein
MARLAVMLPVAKGVPPAIIGIAALLGADAALLGLGWHVASEAPLSVDPVAESRWAPPDLDPRPAAMGPARALEPDDPVLARPIFFPARKPFEPPPVSEATPPPAPPRPPPPDPVFVADGIMLTGSARKAHLRQPQEIDGQWYTMGQVIDGWTIVQIDAGGIVLEQADRKFEMGLYSDASSAFRKVRRSSRRAAQ